MSDVFYLALRYLAYHRFKTGLMIAAIALVLYLPIGLNVLVQRGSRQLTARAASTDLIVGAKGSGLELVLRSLYFQSDVPPDLPYSAVRRVAATGFAVAIPIHAKYRAGPLPIVGTSIEYFAFRDLRPAAGRLPAQLGDCVLGARAAALAEAEVGGQVMSSPESVFDIAGVYPLKMNVVGILEPTGTPDDDAMFVDVKTTWVIAGLGHGHEQPAANAGESIQASSALRNYTQITDENRSRFHFHGDQADFPITAVIAVPRDGRSAALLEGRFLDPTDALQIVRPDEVLEDLLATVLTVRRYVMVGVGLLAIATLAMIVLVFLLSLQIRRPEIETLVKIGASAWRIRSVLLAEIVGVAIAGAALAGLATLATVWIAGPAERLLISFG